LSSSPLPLKIEKEDQNNRLGIAMVDFIVDHMGKEIVVISRKGRAIRTIGLV
jgi:hypothetical protein